MSDNELIMRIAAAIQNRSIARSGSALSGEICLDYATAAYMEMNCISAVNGIGRTDLPEVCGELSDGA